MTTRNSPNELTNIVQFISGEYQQLIASMASLGDEFRRIQQVDNYFLQICEKFVIEDPPNDILLAMLTRAAHRQFYMSISQCFRTEFTESMNSLRHSIESCFIVHFMAKNPNDIQAFRDRKSKIYREVYSNIKAHIKSDPKQYKLAQNLVPLHESASQMSAHSTYEWFIKKVDFSDSDEVRMLYLEVPRNHDEFLFYYYFFLATYALIIILIDQSLGEYKTTDLLDERERKELYELCQILEKDRMAAHDKMDRSQ